MANHPGYLNSTTLAKRNLWIVTRWLPEYGLGPSSSIFRHDAPQQPPLWTREYDGSMSAGGLDEAHHAVVARVRAGTLP